MKLRDWRVTVRWLHLRAEPGGGLLLKLPFPWVTRRYEAVVMASRPASYWPLTDSSGVGAKEATGNGCDGTYYYQADR